MSRLLGPADGLSFVGRDKENMLDLPSWLCEGDADDYMSNPYQVIELTCEGRTERFFTNDPPKAEILNRYDAQKVRGKVGARHAHSGTNPSKVPIKFWIFTGSDERRWETFQPLVNPALRNVKHTVATIRYPTLNRYALNQAYIYKVEEKLGMDQAQVLTVVLEASVTVFVGEKGKNGRGKVVPLSYDIVQANAFSGDKPLRDARAAVINPADEAGDP